MPPDPLPSPRPESTRTVSHVNLSGDDLTGADRNHDDLRAADLRGTCLAGADAIAQVRVALFNDAGATFSGPPYPNVSCAPPR